MPRERLDAQKEYGQMLLELGSGTQFSDRLNCLTEDEELGSSLVRLPLIPALTDLLEAITFIYPNGFDRNNMFKSSILASTNETGDEWNSLVQELNPNLPKEYISADLFDQVDDPNCFIKEMLTVEQLNSFNHNGCPSSKLILKVDDVCILLRNINRREGLTNNTRVRIVDMNRFSIRVQTLGSVQKHHVISRIKFNFSIPFGKAFTMTRTQFPLRLAYCMTFNKAQGQEWDRVLLDIRKSPFSHGHLYVAASRIRESTNKYSNILRT